MLFVVSGGVLDRTALRTKGLMVDLVLRGGIMRFWGNGFLVNE